MPMWLREMKLTLVLLETFTDGGVVQRTLAFRFWLAAPVVKLSGNKLMYGDLYNGELAPQFP